MPKTNSTMDVTSRFYGRPLLVDESFASYLNQQYGNQLNVADASLAEDAKGFLLPSAVEAAEGGSIKTINVSGTLLHGVSWGGYYATGYDHISKQLADAEADPAVRGVALMINSHGGEVAGCFECADNIKNFSKPIKAIVGSHAHSAAYALASAADSIVMPETGSVGSVGVVTLHIDASAMLDDVGIKPTFIFAGKHKVDGNPYEPLSKPVKADIQERIDSLYDVFVTAVADSRPMEPQQVRDTEARTFGAEDALSVGLADSVASPTQALSEFDSELSSSNMAGEITMAEKQTGAEATTNVPTEVTAEQKAAIVAEARTEERARIQGIIESEEASGKQKFAMHVALHTDTGLEAAKALISASPEEAASDPAPAAESGSAFEDAMNASDHPGVGAGDEGNETEDSAATDLFATWDKTRGRKA